MKNYGTWKIGHDTTTIISDNGITNLYPPIPSEEIENKVKEIENYGGYLVCEGIDNIEVAKLIAAAPDMLKCLNSLKNWFQEINPKMDSPLLKQLESTIKQAT